MGSRQAMWGLMIDVGGSGHGDRSDGGQVSWLMVVRGRGKKFVFVLGYEGCLYLVTNCICIWLRTSVETSYTGLLSVRSFVGPVFCRSSLLSVQSFVGPVFCWSSLLLVQSFVGPVFCRSSRSSNFRNCERPKTRPRLQSLTVLGISGLRQSWSSPVSVFFQSWDWTSKH